LEVGQPLCELGGEGDSDLREILLDPLPNLFDLMGVFYFDA